jgi:hypothetical protein
MATKIKATTVKKVPYKWYKEVCNEMARSIMEAKAAPLRQQKRINAVIASGLDYEVMQGGAGHSWQIPLSKLYQYLADAKAVDVDAKIKAWKEFKATHEGVKGIEGNLRAAKMEAELKKLKYPKFDDSNKYDFFGKLINKHYLSNQQANKLMEFCANIGIL